MKTKIMNTLFLAAVASLITLTSCNDVEDRLGTGQYPSRSVLNASYYIDSQNGDDSGDGRSPETAWKTLERVHIVHMQAGNSILLKKGSVWTGQLAPKGTGTASAPITISTYGDGAMPVINGGGTVEAAIKLTNQSHWTIEGIEVTNTASLRDAYRCGIMVENSGGATVSGITIRNNKVHDVTGSFGYSGVYHPHQFGGISVTTKSVTVGEEKFDNILIEGNHVEKVGRTGIVVWDFVWGSNTQSSTNVVIRGNTVKDIDSDGILTYGCNGSLLEHNLADGCGSWREDGGFNGSAAIWCTRGKNCIVQYNEARNTKALEGNDDGTGFDIDLESTDCIVQYNYSHDNEGGFMLIIDANKESASPSNGSIVRYNISQNDGERIFMIAGGVTPNMKIYNNTIYIKDGLDTKIIDHTWDNAGDLDAAWSFQNNIIYNLGSGGYNIPGNGGVFKGNLYYGNHPSSEPAENGKLTVDPKLVNPGSGNEGISSLAGYKLQADSPVINAGVQVSSNGGLDFWGDPVSRKGQATIGAHEPNGEVQEGGYLYDPLNDWSVVDSYSSNLDLDNSNPQFFDEDASRAVRQNKEDGVLVYHLDGLKSAKVTVFLGVWYGASSPDVIKMYVSSTGDEGDYRQIATRGASAGDVVEGWQKFEVLVNEVLPDGIGYLKVAMVDTFNEAWVIQLGEVEISDDPAEVIEPGDNSFTDPLDNKSLMAFNTGENLINAWSSPEDIETFFNGDAGRIARQSGAAEMMAWQYAGIADFALTAYYCGDPGADPDFLKVLGASVFSLESMVEIPVEMTLVAVRGDWREYIVTPAANMPSGYNYLAVQLTQSALVAAGWELQIAEVKISDQPLPGRPQVLTDNLDDMSKLTWKTDNVVTDWGNEANFDGDGARATRSSSATGYLVYECENIVNFDITAFFSTFIDNAYLKVYGSNVFSLDAKTEIPCDFTEISTSSDFTGYSVTPTGEIPAGYRYLLVEMVEIPTEGNGWTTQVGTVSITYKPE